VFIYLFDSKITGKKLLDRWKGGTWPTEETVRFWW